MWRHRTWNFNAQSGRYSEFKEDCFYYPETWRLQSESNKQGSDGVIQEDNAETLTMLLDQHYEESYRLYQGALDMGVAKEQARIFLPGFAVYYTWICKIDAHNLMHFLKLRMDPHAQEEIRVYALAIYEEFFKPLLPWTAEAFEEYILK